jgi:hypothetical protein
MLFSKQILKVIINICFEIKMRHEILTEESVLWVRCLARSSIYFQSSENASSFECARPS